MEGGSFAPRAELSEQEKDAIKAVFDNFDKSGDGFLELTEMEDAIRTVASSIPEDEVKLLVDDLDENGDGQLDFQEFYTVMRKKMLGLECEDDVIQAFQLIDRDKNGFLSPPELRFLLTTTGRNPLSSDEADELIHLADSDGDGLINYQEFFRWLGGEVKAM
eukprot:TRINITY_DN100937_c0_g1_i1.p1 TRINITY_DN100937_c0_g1~~TRINITY_DN100937_c0_g1_i1.p1  ORF type:complete len:175 (-),score=33.80 TRINITY_DN100937_c0_g1_i1:60-545(-)